MAQILKYSVLANIGAKKGSRRVMESGRFRICIIVMNNTTLSFLRVYISVIMYDIAGERVDLTRL